MALLVGLLEPLARLVSAAPSAIVLLGPSGSGKSETGNTLLGDRRFKVSAGLESETLIPQAETVDFEGRSWQVVDTPGYFDTTRTSAELDTALEKFSDIIGETIAALVFVVPYGRFGDAHLRGWRLLKSAFGPTAANHTSLVFSSCGDRTEEDIRAETARLCAKSPPPMLCTVLNELGNSNMDAKRLVAFGKLEPQRQARDRARLFGLAAELERAAGGRGYDHGNFLRARARRKSFASRIAAVANEEERKVLELLLANVEAGAETDEALARRLDTVEGVPESRRVLLDFEDRSLGPFQQVGNGWRQPMPVPYVSMSDFRANSGGRFMLHTGSDSGVRLRHGDQRTGELRSQPFYLGKGDITWEGTGSGGFVAVCSANYLFMEGGDDGICVEKRLRRRSTSLETGSIGDGELTSLFGKSVYIRIVDDRTNGWGFLAIDNLEYPVLEPPKIEAASLPGSSDDSSGMESLSRMRPNATTQESSGAAAT